MVSRRRMVAAGSLVGRNLGRFRFVERDARLRLQSRSLPVSESHLPVDVSGRGHPAGASSLRDIAGTNVEGIACEEPKKWLRTWTGKEKEGRKIYIYIYVYVYVYHVNFSPRLDDENNKGERKSKFHRYFRHVRRL